MYNYSPTISEIRLDLNRMSFDRNSIDTLAGFISKLLKALKSKTPSQLSVSLIDKLNYLNEVLESFNQYREEQQQNIFVVVVNELNELLDPIEDLKVVI